MNRLRTVLFQGASSDTLDLQEKLARATGRTIDAAQLEAAGLGIEADGRERLGPALNLGPLATLAAQLAAARVRLAAGRPALVRSGIVDQDPGLYLLFEPSAERGSVLLSMLAIPGIGNRFPIPPESEDAAQLYRAVAARRDEYIAIAQPWYDLCDIPFDAAGLIAALDRDLAAARRLLASARRS